MGSGCPWDTDRERGFAINPSGDVRKIRPGEKALRGFLRLMSEGGSRGENIDPADIRKYIRKIRVIRGCFFPFRAFCAVVVN